VRNDDTSEYDLSIGLNYAQAAGSAQLLRWVMEHTELVCNPPYADWRCALTIGSTGALEQALRMFCGRERCDTMLTEEYSFSTALETALPLGMKIVGVSMDEQGLIPEAMNDMLCRWDPRERKGARKPHLLYTVPSGQNPTGATQGEQRRRDVYAVAHKHDLFIIEDEPYYFLQMPELHEANDSNTCSSNSNTPSPTGPIETDTTSFLSSLLPPFVSLDTDGRVLRLDSFSKVIVPGARLGWVTGSEEMIERYIRHAEVASQGPSGFSQIALHTLLDEDAGGWGHEGYLKWLMQLRDRYTRRRDVLLAACETFLPREIVSWDTPRAGMFVSRYHLLLKSIDSSTCPK
jgi:aromatic amino acid aminotransferase I / 2-aminoadipate transaminase